VQLPKIEVPSGVIDGVNTLFITSEPYVAGQLYVFLNGLLQRRDYDDGWIETNPATGAVTLKEAPQTTDVLQVYYIPSAPGSTSTTSCTVLRAVLDTTSSALVGRLSTPTALRVNFKCGCP